MLCKYFVSLFFLSLRDELNRLSCVFRCNCLIYNINLILIELCLHLQLAASNLRQRDDENNAFCGYRESDVKLEVNRASRLVRKSERSFRRFLFEFQYRLIIVGVFVL